MNIVRIIGTLSRNCTKGIFLTDASPRGKKKNDPSRFLGKSRTRIDEYLSPLPDREVERNENTIPGESLIEEGYDPDDIEGVDLNAEEPTEAIWPEAAGNTEDFESLERSLSDKEPAEKDIYRAGELLNGMEGTAFYEALQSNEKTKERVSELLSRVRVNNVASGEKTENGLSPAAPLKDMTEFLLTN